MSKRLYIYCFFASIIFIVDRVTKLLALTQCMQSACTVNSLLSFEVVFNRGISWGMFHSSSDIIFYAVSTVIALMTVMLCGYAYHNYKSGNLIVAEVCIIAGSCCNLIDRAMYGGVVDFIVLSYGQLSWPVFNIADAVIVFGIGLFILRYEE